MDEHTAGIDAQHGSEAAHAAMAQSGETVREGYTCIQCDYDLQQLDTASSCPECGASVAPSLAVPLLRYQEPEWVKKLSWGMGLVIAYFILMVLAMAIAMVLGMGAAMQSAAANEEFKPHWIGLITLFITIPSMIVVVAAVWLLTSPSVALAEHSPRELERQTARYLLPVLFVLALLSSAITNMLQLPQDSIWPMIVSLPLNICWLVGLLAMGRHLEYLVRMLPHRSWAMQVRWLTWGVVAIVVLSLVIAVVITIAIVAGIYPSSFGTPGPAGSQSVPSVGEMVILAFMGVFGCVVGLGGLVVGGWTFVLSILLYTRFRGASEQAAYYLGQQGSVTATG